MRLAAVPAVLALAAAAAIAVRQAGPARGAGPGTLWISGMRIDGTKPAARVRLTNVSASPSDVYSVHYTIRETGAGIPISEPAAGLGAQLLPGHALDLDLGAIVTQYRAAHGAGPYGGTVQFVAFAEGGLAHDFGPEVIHVECTQIEGSAIFEGVVQWTSQ